MNRYPLWKNATVLIAMVLGLLYTLPNFFGEAPAVQVASVKATHKVDAKLLGRVEEVLKAASVAPQGSCSTSTAYVCGWPIPTPRSRRRTRSKSAQSGSGRCNLQRGAQSRVELAELVERHSRPADVPRPRPAGRCALPAAGRHEGRADQAPGLDRRRLARPDARQEHTPWRHQPRRAERGDPFPRSGNAGQGARHPGRQPARPFAGRRPGRRRFQARGLAQARSAEAHPGVRCQAEHHHPAQPDQRTGRRRAGDPAAGRGPHRGAVAGRAGHGQGQGHPRPHRNPGSAHGRRRGQRQPGIMELAARGQPPAGTEYYVERGGRGCW
jgi:hypothetical protein